MLNEDAALIRVNQVPIELSFDKQPVTVEFAIDPADLSKGFSDKSNPITGWLGQREAISDTRGKQEIDFSYGFLNSISIAHIRACFNESDDTPIVEELDPWDIPNFGRYHVDLRNYRTATYELREDGKVIQSGPIEPEVVDGQWWLRRGGMCALKGDSYMGFPTAPFHFMQFYPLSPGKIFKLTYTLTGESSPVLSGSLDFVTPGGCPQTDALATISANPNFVTISPTGYALLDENQNFLARLPTFSPYIQFMARYTSRAAVEAGRLAPLYQTWSKSYFNPSPEWQYIPSIDDWTKPLSNATPLTTSDILQKTIYSGCKASQVDVAVTEEPIEGESNSCETLENLVVPKYTGLCLVRVSVRRITTTKLGVRKQSAPVTLRVPVSFKSLGRFAVTRTKSGVVVSTISVKVARSVSASSLAADANLKVTRTSKTTLKVSPAYAKYCKVYRSTVRGLKPGLCKISVTVTPKTGKATTRTVNLKVNK